MSPACQPHAKHALGEELTRGAFDGVALRVEALGGTSGEVDVAAFEAGADAKEAIGISDENGRDRRCGAIGRND